MIEPPKYSGAWYQLQTERLKKKVHEIKMEFDPMYRRTQEMLKKFDEDTNRAIWAGDVSLPNQRRHDWVPCNKFRNGFLPQIR